MGTARPIGFASAPVVQPSHVLTYREQGWGCWTAARCWTANRPSWRGALRRFSFLLKQYKRAQSINPSAIPLSSQPTPIPASPPPALSLSLSLAVLSLTLHPFVPQRKTRCLSPCSSCGPHPTFRFLLNPRPLSWQTARSNLVLQPVPFTPRDTSQPHSTCTPILYAPYRQFFFPSLSNLCLGACPLNESPPRRCTSSDVHNRETYDACHTGLALGVSEMPSRLRARFFFFRREPTEVLDLAEVLEQPL